MIYNWSAKNVGLKVGIAACGADPGVYEDMFNNFLHAQRYLRIVTDQRQKKTKYLLLTKFKVFTEVTDWG